MNLNLRPERCRKESESVQKKDDRLDKNCCHIHFVYYNFNKKAARCLFFIVYPNLAAIIRVLGEGADIYIALVSH